MKISIGFVIYYSAVVIVMLINWWKPESNPYLGIILWLVVIPSYVLNKMVLLRTIFNICTKQVDIKFSFNFHSFILLLVPFQTYLFFNTYNLFEIIPIVIIQLVNIYFYFLGSFINRNMFNGFIAFIKDELIAVYAKENIFDIIHCAFRMQSNESMGSDSNEGRKA